MSTQRPARRPKPLVQPPVPCINVGDRLRAVVEVEADIEELATTRTDIIATIADTDPEETDTLATLNRELASVTARITPMDDAMRARLSHLYRPRTKPA
jgi:hypothetical protein